MTDTVIPLRPRPAGDDDDPRNALLPDEQLVEAEDRELDEDEIVDQRVAKLVEAATLWAEHCPVIENDKAAADCNEFLKQLEDAWRLFDKQRHAEKKPHDDAVAAVQAKWKPRLDRLWTCRVAIKPLHDAWVKLKQRRLDEERQRAQREAEAARARAEELARQAEAGRGAAKLANAIAAQEAQVEAKQARARVRLIPERAQTRGILGGRARSLSKIWKAEVVDLDKAFRHYRACPEIREVLNRLASFDARSGVREIPGCFVYEEEI